MEPYSLLTFLQSFITVELNGDSLDAQIVIDTY